MSIFLNYTWHGPSNTIATMTDATFRNEPGTQQHLRARNHFGASARLLYSWPALHEYCLYRLDMAASSSCCACATGDSSPSSSDSWGSDEESSRREFLGVLQMRTLRKIQKELRRLGVPLASYEHGNLLSAARTLARATRANGMWNEIRIAKDLRRHESINHYANWAKHKMNKTSEEMEACGVIPINLLSCYCDGQECVRVARACSMRPERMAVFKCPARPRRVI